MCGIYGVLVKPQAKVTWPTLQRLLASLALLSTSRGKEASGAAFLSGNSIYYTKEPISASKLLKSANYKKLLDLGKQEFFSQNVQPVAFMGHSRLVTNGSQYSHENNQPVNSNGILAIHNGIVTNVDELWKNHKNLTKQTQLDTEILLALISDHIKKSRQLEKSIRQTYSEMEGAASLALFFSELDKIVLVTNTGSLYVIEAPEMGVLIFASEKYFLQKIAARSEFHGSLSNQEIQHQKPFTGRVIELTTLSSKPFSFFTPDPKENQLTFRKSPRSIIDITKKQEQPQKVSQSISTKYTEVDFKDEFLRNKKKVDALRLCTKCVLPETMPFIEFDENGVCNYCRGYHSQQPKGVAALRKDLEPYISQTGEDPDLLITFSGGRDSSYCLHYVVKEMGLRPVTYTYDWGMITDLGRRNAMRMCGKLGVENILVSADLAIKRSNIRKNVEAWLKHPELGTVPLFMAGDKQYFYYANKIGEQTGCKMVMLCENPFEATFFKYGFCGIKPNFNGEHIYSISLSDKAKMAGYYLRQYLRNPAYLNSSILDTLSAYMSYYFIPHRFINFYNYILWDEKTINDALINEYNWETASDTKSTWRIGDGTASFYNYIYYTMAGLTENDTFRSYQIRENMISRDEALSFVERDNQPRYESIEWYCDLIGINFPHTITEINRAKKLY